MADQSREELENHVFGEAMGGYTECSCGWPSREQWEAGEPAALHVVQAVRPLIEQQVREQVADEIAAVCGPGGCLSDDCEYQHAARIARGDD